MSLQTIQNISCSDLAAMMSETADLQVLDVRTAEEFQHLGHIPGSKLIPLTELPYAYRMLDMQAPIVVVCQHGVRSLNASHFLQSAGAKTVYNVQEGFVGWTGPVAFGPPEQ